LAETEAVSGTGPVWEYAASALLEADLLLDPRRHLILKVWHQAGHTNRDRELDQVSYKNGQYRYSERCLRLSTAEMYTMLCAAMIFV
jgi:hypothetical protein